IPRELASLFEVRIRIKNHGGVTVRYHQMYRVLDLQFGIAGGVNRKRINGIDVRDRDRRQSPCGNQSAIRRQESGRSGISGAGGPSEARRYTFSRQKDAPYDLLKHAIEGLDVFMGIALGAAKGVTDRSFAIFKSEQRGTWNRPDVDRGGLSPAPLTGQD